MQNPPPVQTAPAPPVQTAPGKSSTGLDENIAASAVVRVWLGLRVDFLPDRKRQPAGPFSRDAVAAVQRAGWHYCHRAVGYSVCLLPGCQPDFRSHDHIVDFGVDVDLDSASHRNPGRVGHVPDQGL